MYETEANNLVEGPEQIPSRALKSFGSLAEQFEFRTVLPWSEHCTECVWPTCYSTCDLYSARQDGRCRRFVDGMVRVDLPSATNSYLLKIRFKRWGKLWTPGNVRLHTVEAAEKLEKRDESIGKLLQGAPLPGFVRSIATRKRYGLKKRAANSSASGPELPTCFVVECYNPEQRDIQLSLTMRSAGALANIPFQKLITLTPGFHCVRVLMAEISAMIDVRRPFEIELVPNDDAEESIETTLYFGLMDFIREIKENKKIGKGEGDKDTKDKKIKCVVWDLDNTLWDGVLVEDGAERLQLKPDVAAVIQTLDSRGILQSIASKNNPEEALEVLKGLQLDDYFLCPQISWQPKSHALKTIAEQLNIGLDSILFIDDSQFEREEVKAVHPEVRILDASEYRTLPDRSECIVPITDESKERRKLYKVEMSRQLIAQNFSNDYIGFLRHCQIELKILPMTESNIERVHELTQRTNQMNFSGNRYDRDVLRGILTTPYLDTYVLSCQDRFGNYGVVGFSIVDRREPRMTDLMFSCRIQSKRIEHAFLTYVIRKYIAETGNDFHANYRKTPRNAPSGQVFTDLLMEEMETKDGVLSLVFRKDREVPDDAVISVVVQEAVPEARQAEMTEAPLPVALS
jgi:FkbH-like protein